MNKKDIVFEKAFIAANKYIVKEINREGAGVLASYDLEIEKSETKRINNLYTKNVWFDITIPSKDFLLDMAKPVSEQSSVLQNNLFSNEALAFLFNSESRDMDKRVKEYISDIQPDRQLQTYNDEMKVFYDRKIKLLKDLDSGLSLMNFIVEHTVKKDIEIASGYLDRFGILGSLYTDEKGERVIIYNPQEYINLEKRHCERLEETLLIN